ncbi:MAG: hypothetical protein RL346_1242 [Verrucomicrobiota bacterium]
MTHGGWEWPQAEGSALVLGLGKADRGFALFPFAALLEKLHTLETFEDGAFAADGGV